MRTTILGLLALTLTGPALAAPGTVKTMRYAMPAHEVERPINMPKGWLEFAFAYDHKVATGQWTADGEREQWDSAKWTHGVAHLDVRYGIAHRAEIWWSVPVHYGNLSNEALGTNTTDMALGDPWFGVRYALFTSDAPLTSVVLEGAIKGPASQESPGTYLGGPLNVSSFIFETGTADLTLGVAGKRQFGPLALTARATYVKRFSNVVQYLVELNESQFAGRIKPGDQLRADIGVMFQAGPVAIEATNYMTQRMVTRIGTTSPGWSPSKNLDPVVGSEGMSMDLKVQGTVHITRGFDINAYWLLPYMGEDLQFFPIESLQPTLGNTIGGSVELRY